jgi:Flp pilus assembly protein TadB
MTKTNLNVDVQAFKNMSQTQILEELTTQTKAQRTAEEFEEMKEDLEEAADALYSKFQSIKKLTEDIENEEDKGQNTVIRIGIGINKKNAINFLLAILLHLLLSVIVYKLSDFYTGLALFIGGLLFPVILLTIHHLNNNSND